VKQRLKLACQNAADESATFITDASPEVVRSDDKDDKKDFHTDHRFISAQDAFRLSHPIHEDSKGCDLCTRFDEIVNIRQWQKEQSERRRRTRALRKKDAGGKGRMTRDTSANET
jgi:zona occludens toxin (predicted ATPase)